MATTETFIGQPVLRNKEDPDLLTGQANFIDNMTMAGMAWMAMVRPPYVHATVDSIDTAAAKAMPGVVGVYTGADLEPGRAAVRLAHHRGHQGADPLRRSRTTRSGSTATRSPSWWRRRASRRWTPPRP